jgi:uncharacterized integral membrane protein (TIGR00698 family)
MPLHTSAIDASTRSRRSPREHWDHAYHAKATPAPFAQGVWPGLFLTTAIAGLAFAVRQIPGVATFSPMILAIVMGISFHNIVGTPKWAKDGVTFSLRRILRFAIILLGLQLTAQQVVEVGPLGLAIIAATLLGTFAFTTWLGGMMGVDRKLTQLIAAGTSICGASAVIATNTVTKGHDEDVAYAVACVTVFGSIAMFLYPILPGILHLNPHAFGLWAGASIHEIAQVVAAAPLESAGQSVSSSSSVERAAIASMPVAKALAQVIKIARPSDPHAN